MNLKAIIKTALIPIGLPIAYLNYNGSETAYVTYFRYNEQGEEWAENEQISTCSYYQIDIWKKISDTTDIDLVEEQVKEALKSVGFMGFIAQDLYENDAKIFHTAIRCNYIKEKE